MMLHTIPAWLLPIIAISTFIPPASGETVQELRFARSAAITSFDRNNVEDALKAGGSLLASDDDGAGEDVECDVRLAILEIDEIEGMPRELRDLESDLSKFQAHAAYVVIVEDIYSCVKDEPERALGTYLGCTPRAEGPMFVEADLSVSEAAIVYYHEYAHRKGAADCETDQGLCTPARLMYPRLDNQLAPRVVLRNECDQLKATHSTAEEAIARTRADVE